MAITVPFDLGYEFEVKAPFAEVFDVLADVPLSASHFPKVDRLVDLGGGAYRWELRKIGGEVVSLQTIYASKYVADRKRGTVTWTPVAGVGNGSVAGSRTITAKQKSTRVVLKINGELTLPGPALLAPVVAPIAKAENEKLIEQYIDNLILRFGGEV
jgi:carbon monoxide dehydrogenase subunit G